MGFDKYYPNRKDWRKPYFYGGGSKAKGCRPNGGCAYCYSNRFHSIHKKLLSANEQLKEYFNCQEYKDELIEEKYWFDFNMTWDTPDEWDYNHICEKYFVKYDEADGKYKLCY